MQHNTLRPKRRRGRLALAVLTSATIALTACSAPAATSEEAPTTIDLAVMQQPGSLDPVELSEGSDAFLWSSIYDTLLLTDSEGEIVPNAAKSFEYSDDGTTLTLTLRDDLLFSTGEAPTSSDVKYGLDRIRSTPGAGQFQLSKVSDVQAPDDSTIVLTLSEPDPNLTRYLTMRAGIIADEDTVDDDSTQLNPVGSGPYTLNEEKSTAGSSYVLERRDDYWGADAFPFETVSVKVMADATATENALRSGQLDVSSIPPTSKEAFEKQGFSFTTVDVTAVFQLLIPDRDGTIQPALKDVRVRQAINMAFDRAAIAKSALAGLGTPTTQVFFPFFPGSVEELDSLYPYDPEKAKDLMAEAGYADGFSVTMPSLIYTPTFEPLVTQALADIGITVSWNPIPPQETTSAITSGSYPMVLWVDGVSPAAALIDNHFQADGFLNPLHVEDPELAPLVDEAMVTVDPDRQAELYEQINTYTVENAFDAPLAFSGQLFATAPGYKYVGTSPMNISSLRVFDVAD